LGQQLCLFAFLLAISEVNTFLAFRSFVWDEEDKMELLHFRRLLALALINMEWRGDENKESHATRKRRMKHTLATAPTHTTQFLGGKWSRNAKSAYQQHICRGQKCKKQVQSHRACTPGHWLCVDCFQNHVLDEYYLAVPAETTFLGF
jgi:hypothetical protein